MELHSVREDELWTKISLLPERERKLVEVALRPENAMHSRNSISKQAGYPPWTWRNALKSNREFAELAKWLRLPRVDFAPHEEVTLATDPVAEADKDVWDMRRFYVNYPRHLHPCNFILNFAEIASSGLRAQIKGFFRAKLGIWAPRTFEANFDVMRWVCNTFTTLYPSMSSFSELTREHVEVFLAKISTESAGKRIRVLSHTRAMFEWMHATNAPEQPPRGLIRREDMPRAPQRLPKPIPLYFRQQIDRVLQEADRCLSNGEKPPARVEDWVFDALIIMRWTGRRTEDVANLFWDCLHEDDDGDPYMHIDYNRNKTKSEHDVPLEYQRDMVVRAIKRQQQRSADLPPLVGVKFLFANRGKRGRLITLTKSHVKIGIENLIKHTPIVREDGAPYHFSAHQFRHTVATEMIERGVDPFAVKQYLGHTSYKMTSQYVMLSSRFMKEEVRRKMSSPASEKAAGHLGELDTPFTSKWLKGKIAVFRNGGGGWCEHPLQSPACPKRLACRRCFKFRTDSTYLTIYEQDVSNYTELYESALKLGLVEKAEDYKADLELARRIRDQLVRIGCWDGYKDLESGGRH